MKIIQIIPSLSSGGAERFVVNLSNQFVAMGHDVMLCVFSSSADSDFNKQFLCDKVVYNNLDIKGKSYLHILFKIYNIVKDYRPDIIHCHLAVLHYLLLVYLLNRKVRVFHTIHSMPKYACGDNVFFKNIFRFLYSTNLVIPITISKECQESFYNFYNLNRVNLIENGVSQVEPTTQACDVMKEVKANNQDGPIFIHIARYHPAKNQRMLIDAFNEMYDSGMKFSLLILGRGFSSGDGLTIFNIACPQIYFLGEKNNVGDYLLLADYFCLTSKYEGLPISLLEAMSVGVTPISTPAGGVVNVIEDGKTGFLSTDFSKESYKAAITRALHNKIEKTSIINSYKMKFSIELCAKRYISLFERFI